MGTLLPNTPYGTRTQALVYTKSTLVEQSTPTTFALSDSQAVVPSVEFTDYDLDLGDLGGLVLWGVPGDVQLVSMYYLYLADVTPDPIGPCNITNSSGPVMAFNGPSSAQGAQPTLWWCRGVLLGTTFAGPCLGLAARLCALSTIF